MMNTSNTTFDDHLQQLNDQYALDNVAAISFLLVLMLTGLVGNSLVFYIYLTKIKSSTSRCFILALSLIDLITSSVCIAIDIVDLRYKFTFGKIGVIPCKLSALAVTFTTFASVNILIAVAAVRHNLVCYPNGNQTTIRTAKVAVLLSCIFAVVFALPSVIIYGGQTKMTEIPGVDGTLCTISDEYVGTIYPLVDNVWQFVSFLAAMITLSVLYIRIWRTVSRFAHTKKWSCKSTGTTTGISHTGSESQILSVSWQTTTSTPVVVRYPGLSDKKVKATRPSKRQMSARRTTLMLFMITLTFGLSYLPTLALMGTRALNWELMENLRGAPLAAYNFFLRSYFINCAVNPLIYSYFNTTVRKELRAIFKVVSK